MTVYESCNRNLRFCMDFRDLSSSELAFRLHEYEDIWNGLAWSKNAVTSRRKMRRIITRKTEPLLRDMESFGQVLRVPPALLVFGTLDELEATLKGRP